jgi:hypothetical protein
MDSEEIVRVCYEWQINNLKADGWVKRGIGKNRLSM